MSASSGDPALKIAGCSWAGPGVTDFWEKKLIFSYFKDIIWRAGKALSDHVPSSEVAVTGKTVEEL